jgi:hypothetical protein
MSIWDKLAERFLLFLGVALWPLALVFVGGFPMRQGIVLGLLLAWLAFGIGKAAVKPARRFTPYWVRVSPNWYQILSDFALVGSPEEWRSIREAVRPCADYSVLRDGVLFTVLQHSEDWTQDLVFWNQHQSFGSELRFREDMSPIQFERKDPAGGHIPAYLFMKPYGQYNMGIEVRDWWWDKVKGSCATPLSVETNPMTGTVELTLATLSLNEFDFYWAPVNWTDEYVLKTKPQIRQRRDEQGLALGWIAKDLRIPELSVRVPVYIEHKYFVVEHREI